MNAAAFCIVSVILFLEPEDIAAYNGCRPKATRLLKYDIIRSILCIYIQDAPITPTKNVWSCRKA